MDEQQDGITAYHGSPHDFEQFDTSKIGTGEGAQSYGHGLYFAGHEPVAKGYAKELAKQQHVDPFMHFDGGAIYQGQDLNDLTPSQIAAHVVADNGIDTAHKLMGEWSQDHYSGPMWKSALQELHANPDKFANAKWQHGHMYEVHINAHPDHMLDWDKPLSKQPSHITKSLFDVRKKLPTLWEKTQHHINNDSTAGDFYQSIAAGHPHGYAGATEQLSRAGIKGIKYLDAGSRSDKAKQTHNYVVFDHNDVHIKRKYEQGGAVNGYEDGGDVWDDSRVRRSGEGGTETALDFIQNAPLYKQRMEDQKQPQPQAAPAPAPQTESKPMPVIAAPPPAIIRAAEPAPPAPVQQQPQAQSQTGLFHIGTNDTDPNLTVKSAQRIIDASRTMGIDPVFLLPNQSVKKPYAETSKALQKYLDDNGIQYHMPEYESGDPAHMSHEWVNNFAKTYNNPFIAGDSNSVRLGNWGYGAKGTALVHPDSKAILGRVGAGSKDIADELDKHLKWYQQNAPQHRSDGGEVDRRQMHHKDVTERVPQLTEGANKLAQGEIDKHEYQRLVNQHKPVHPYESVPAPATHEEMYAALQENKRDKLGQAENIPEGHPVGLRLDIPAYKDHGVWVPTIHNQSDHKTIAHGSHAMVSDATFKIPQNKALKVATGTAKSPFATIDGNFNHISHEDAIQLAAHALNHPEWTQVGMDPERHGFFYDRRTQRPVKNAAKVLQVGPLVLAHHAELGDLSDPEYHYALGGNIGHREHFDEGGDASGGDDQGSGGDATSDDDGGGMGGSEGGGGNDNAGAPSDAPVAEEKPGEVKPPPPMPLTPQNMGTNLGYDSIPNATFTPAAPTALPPSTSFQQFAGGGLVDAALKKVSNKYTDTGLPLNAMEILSKIARTG